MLLLVEIIARTLKNKLRASLRKRMKQLRIPMDEPFTRLHVSFLNLIFGKLESFILCTIGDTESNYFEGNHRQSQRYWNIRLKRDLLILYVSICL